MLKFGADFGHKRALYKYGYLLYEGSDKHIKKDESKGIKYIRQASYLNYKKAIKFCVDHNISYKKFGVPTIKEYELKNFDLDEENGSNLELFDLDETAKTYDLFDEQKENSFKLSSTNSKISNIEGEANISDSISSKNDERKSDLIMSDNIENDKKGSDSNNINDDESTSDLMGFWF